MTKNGPDLTECVKSGPFCINARLFLELDWSIMRVKPRTIGEGLGVWI